MKIHSIFYILFISLFSIIINAQEKKNLKIEYAGRLTIDEVNYPGAKILTRDESQQVLIAHGNINLWSDKAIYYSSENFIEAYGNVKMIQADTVNMTSKYIEYSGKTQLAFASGDVILKDPNSTISSDTLYFDRIKQQAFYKNKGKVEIDSSGTITSKIGLYYMNEKKHKFVEDVVLNDNKDTTINTNFFDFYTDTGYGYLFGPSTITTPDSKTYCEKGFYDTKNKTGYALKKAKINYDDRIIEGDSLYFDNNISFASASNNIKITDTLNDGLITGHYAEIFKEKDSLFITKRALAITKQENDSIYIHADKIMVTGKPDNRIVQAYYNAKIFKADLSGKADSISSNQKTGITKLINLDRFAPSDKFSTKRRPIMWHIDNQMTGDTIHLISNPKTEKLDSLLVFENAFIISKDTISEDGYNQISGKKLVGLFNEKNELRKVDIIKNAQSIFYSRNEEQELIGIDKAKSGSISILFADGDIEEYTRFNQVDGDLYPESEYPIKEKILKGFDWREEERLKVLEDLFKDDKPVVLPIIKGLDDYVPQEDFFDDGLMERINSSQKNKIIKLTSPQIRNISDKNKVKEVFQVILNVFAEKNDDFQLFYVADSKTYFNEKKSTRVYFKGNNENQLVIFELPKKIKPSKIRIDIGSNKTQNSLQINSIIIRFKQKEIFIPEHLIIKYLIPNQHISYDKNENKFNLSIIKTNKNLKYDPFFISSPELIELLNNL